MMGRSTKKSSCKRLTERRKFICKKLEKYVQDNNIKGMSGKTNSDGEVMYRDLEKGVYLFVQTQKTQISNALKLHYNTNKDRTLVNSSSIS